MRKRQCARRIIGRIGAQGHRPRIKFKSASDQKLVCEWRPAGFVPNWTHYSGFLPTQRDRLEQNDDANGVDARLEFEAKKDTESCSGAARLT